jgi:hypothetical protein
MYEIYGYPYGNPDAELLIYQPGNKNGTVLSPKLTREVSKGGSLTFTMTREHPMYEMLQKMSTVVVVKQDGKETWRGRIFSHEADWYNNRAVYCEGALSFFNDSCVTPFNYEGTLKEFLQHLIDVHNAQVGQKMKMFELGTVTAALGDQVVHFGDADQYGVGEDYGKVWDIIDKLVLKVFGGYAYCTFDAATGYNVLNYCDQAVEEKRVTAQKIEYGVNLLDLTEKTDTNGLYTRIYPVGNKHTVKETRWKYKFKWLPGGLGKYTDEHEERYGIMDTDSATIQKYLPQSGYRYDLEDGYIENTDAVKKFGVIARIVEFDTDSANDTFAAGVQALQQNHLMVTSYTIKAVDLVDAGEATERLTFACYAHILSAPHSVDAIMLCSKLTEPLDHPEKKEYSFGMTRRTLTDRHVENLGKTNLLDESNAASESYNQQLIDHLKKTDKNVTEAAKTATNFLEWSEADGLIVRHESLPGKRVQITHDGVKVLSDSSMVNIQSDSISITDGNGSCTINSGKITFYGIRQDKIWENGDPDSGMGDGAVICNDGRLRPYSAIVIGFGEYYTGLDGSGVNGSDLQYTVFPINGIWSIASRVWDYPRVRRVHVSYGGITFGQAGYYREGAVGVKFSKHDTCCVPCSVYGLM